jgi:hypothetical protein
MQSGATVPQVPKAAILFPTFSPLHTQPETISQEELGLLLSLRGRLKQLQDDIATEEESLRTRLQAGAIVEPGDHFAQLKENNRRNVSWKDVSIRLANRLKLDGEMYCARVLASTKPTKTVSLEIH